MSRAAKLDTASIARAHRGDDALHIAVTIAPLLAPYKKQGRLSLRVERLPVKARFSKGTRNNDGSWSLATDELEDLVYFLEKETAREHTLAIRIINLSGGNTLAVLEYKVTPEADADADTDEQPTAPPTNAGTDVQVQALRKQLAEMKAALVATESELADAQRAAPAAPSVDLDAEIAAVRAELQQEFEERLVAVGAKSAGDLQKQREAWGAELKARAAEIAATAQQQVAEARKTFETGAQTAVAAARTEWDREAAAERAEAEARWREESERALAAARLEAANAQDQSSGEIEILRARLQREAEDALAVARADWRKEADEELVALRAELSGAHEDGHAATLKTLREKLERERQDALAAAEAKWSAAEAERLAKARADWRKSADEEIEAARAASGEHEDDRAAALKTLREKLEREAKDALRQAELGWKAAEAERLTAARTEWQDASEKTLAEARAQAASLREEGQENQALRDDMTALQAKLAERDAEVVKAQRTIDAVREAARVDAREALAKAEAKWKTDEAARLAAAQSQWRADSDKALAAARSEANFRVDDESSDLDQLRSKVSALETMLAEREASLAEAQEIIEQQRAAAVQRSTKSRRNEDAERMAELENEWRSGYGNALAEATSRYEAAEAALAQVRIRTKDGGRMAQDLASTRAALAAREKELADLRAKFVPLDGEEGSAPIAAPEQSTAKPAAFSRGFIAATIAAAVVVGGLIVFEPTLERVFFPAPLPPPASAPESKADERLAPVAVEELKSTLLRESKLRADPTATAKVVATLSRGSEVIVLERADKWARVRFESAKSLTGWIQQSSLQDAAGK